MTTIYKYPVVRQSNEWGDFAVFMPTHAQIVSVAVVNNEIVIYALVRTTETEMHYRAIFVAGTGKDITKMFKVYINPQLIGTVQQDGFVWHVYQDLV